ncbi:MAG: hypothetical protein E7324_04575 [Clostridiales bacterium]|nr:hypothetical protein [Clostridiales bacterium]
MKRGLILALIAALLLSLMPAALGEEISYVGTVTGGSLHMRKEPTPSGKVLATYKSGTEVDILENDGIWCKVQKGNKTGYMMAQYLTITANYPHLGWGKTPADGALINVHQRPDGESLILYKGISGGAFELVALENHWYKVRIGNQFGYLPVDLITPFEGEFTLGYSPSAASPINAADLKSALREIGNPRTMSRSDGLFTYSFTWPDLGLAAADQAMSKWVQDTLDLFETDHQAHHAQQAAHCQMEYQALKVDDAHQSVLLLAEYTVDRLTVQRMFALNVNAETGEILIGKQLFTAFDQVFLSLESALSGLMGIPCDGYTGKADASWLEYAILTREGLACYLPAGLCLPPALGTQRLLIPWDQIASSVSFHSPLVSKYIRTIDPTKPMIALTFDDGPSEHTERILNVLKEYGGKATFCVQGMNVEKYADVVRRAVAEGHEIASHTWNHKKLTEVSASTVRSQLQRTNDIVKEVTGGYEIRVLRPPYGSTNKSVRNICAEMNMVIAHWKVDTLDWDTRSTSKTYRAIIRGAENGVIVLCHDLYSSTAAAIEQAVPELVEKGYQLVTVSELLSFHKDGAQPGTVYAYLDPENIRTE